MTLNDVPNPRFQDHRVTTDAVDVSCAQLTRYRKVTVHPKSDATTNSRCSEISISIIHI